MLNRSREMFEYNESMTCQNCHHKTCLFNGEQRKPIYHSSKLCCWVSEEKLQKMINLKNRYDDYIV